MSLFAPAPPDPRTYRLLVYPVGTRPKLSSVVGDGEEKVDGAYVLRGEFPSLEEALQAMVAIENARKKTVTAMFIGAYEGGKHLMWIYSSKGDQ
jgi:hypothetical protein